MYMDSDDIRDLTKLTYCLVYQNTNTISGIHIPEMISDEYDTKCSLSALNN